MKRIFLSIGFDFDDGFAYLLQRPDFLKLMDVRQRIAALEMAVMEIEKVIHSSKVLSESLSHKQALLDQATFDLASDSSVPS